MSEYAIKVEGLGKQYRLRHLQERPRYLALRDVIARAFTLGRRARSDSSGALVTDFWALNDVSFEVQHGEVLGIIGRNGAGKSTLLKVLSRITEPTAGCVRLRGSIASLLEVGTGFHPELTGRENIFLNGAILGMSKADIRRKFDDIVAFAEVEPFLDTPVKRYSSGMYVRLAFAVAAHLEPEILIVDEVLAVGDLEFQMKCLGKMKDVSRSGRTVLFVSHNLASITSLCPRAILLASGRIVEDGAAEHTVNAYLQRAVEPVSDQPHVLYVGDRARAGDHAITRIEMLDETDRPKSVVRPLEPVKLRLWLHASAPVPRGSVLLEIASLHGALVAKLETNPHTVRPLESRGGGYVDCCFRSLPLMEGHYALRAGVAIHGVRLLSYIDDAGRLLVSPPLAGTTIEMLRDAHGLLAADHYWECQPAGQTSRAGVAHDVFVG